MLTDAMPRAAAQSRGSDQRIDKVEAARRFIDETIDEGEGGPPTLEQIAAHVGGSPHHLQRTFKRIMGISPAQYGDARRLERLKQRLKEGDDVTGALYEAGYGASSRLYERAPGQLGMTPATYAKGGKGASIAYAVAATPLGHVLVSATRTGVCFICLGDSEAELVENLHDEFPAAEIHRDEDVLADWLEKTVAYLEGRLPHLDLPLDVQATAFQRRVWEELMRIPVGVTRTYSDVAEIVLGKAAGRRAVARACATNPVPLAIPCHRVTRGDGSLGGYRWGIPRKQALIDLEKTQAHGSGD